VLVSEQLLLPAGHSSGAERKNKKDGNSSNPFFNICGDGLATLQITNVRVVVD